MLSIQNISVPPSLSEDNNQQEMFQGENDSNHSTEAARANSDSFADCEDVTPTKTSPECATHSNSVNVENVFTDCDDTEIISKKPPQNELIQDDMATQITNLESKQPFEEKPNINRVSDDILTKRKENEGILLNNRHVTNNFDEVVDQFKRALQSPMNVKSEIQNDPNENVITRDKADDSIEVDYNNATQDKKENSNDGLVVSSNTDDMAVQCPIDGNVTNNIKDENEMKCCGRVLSSQEQMDVLNESAYVTTLTNVSDSSDEESSPKRSRQFTFSDSDLPNDDEIKEILMMYPKPTFIESFSESENSSEDESNRPICRRRRNKPEPLDLTKMLEILPERVLTRLRKQPVRLGFEDIKKNSAILKPTYLTEQENEIDEDIIAVNIRRFKAFGKRNTNKDLKKQKSVKEEKKKYSLRKKSVIKSNKNKKNIKVKPKIKNAKSKSKSNARKSAELKIKNTKDSLVSTSAAKTTTARTRSMKKENDGKNTQNKRILQQENRNKKTNCKQKLTNMKERLRLAEDKVKRSKRQPRAKQKNDGTIKAPISIFKKRIHEQSTVYNISPSSSKSPKSLKRSFVDKSDVLSPKRMKFQNTNNNQELNNNNSSAKKTQQGHLTIIHSKELQQDKRGPYVYLIKYEPVQKQIRMLTRNRDSLNMKTESQTQSRMLHRNMNSLNMKTQSQTQSRMLSRNRNSLNMKTQSQSRMLNRNRNSMNMKTQPQTQSRMLSRNRNSLNMKTQSQSRMLNRNRNSMNMKTQPQTQSRMLSRNRNSLNMKTQSQTRMLNRNRNSMNMKTQPQTQSRMLSRNRNSLNMKTQSQTRMLNRNRNSMNMKTQPQTQSRMLNGNRNSMNMKARTQSARRRYQRACKRRRVGGARK